VSDTDGRGPASNDGYDEAYAAPGQPRAHYAGVLATLESMDLGASRDRLRLGMARREVLFGPDAQAFYLDPVPRLLTAAEWGALSAGLAQRVRALEAFVHDAYGRRAIVAAGVVPERTIDGAEGYEPELRGRLPASAPAIGVAGLDVVRGPDGSFAVLEDNLRIPSGFAYAAIARPALEAESGPLPPSEDFAGAVFAALRATLEAAAPAAAPPEIVVLSDGPENTAFWEHAEAARRLNVPLVTPAEIEVRGERLVRRDADGREHAVDVVYRRSDEDGLRGTDDRLTPIAEKLLAPWLAGHLGLVNGFGTGVADDKAIHAHVEDMVRFYLSEEPLLRSVPTYDLADPRHRAEVLDRLDELVVKPRGGYGGEGVVVCAHASREDIERIAAEIRDRPEAYVAQPTIALSRHPTVDDAGRLAPRHVDLRPFVFGAGGTVTVPPGGLTRVALAAGTLVVNSSQQGGAKDTCVLT
jgi:uncharacterized circularly permuted ATP-grasp superfamily protein